MYSKMNSLAVVGLLAAGVMAQSTAVTTSTTTVPAESGSMVTSSPISTPTSSVTTVDPASLAVVIGNGTVPAPNWVYFSVTATTTVVVGELTTLCPEATTLTFNDCEYPATAGELIVVTNCPCTVTTALPTLTSSICPPGVTVSNIPAPPPVEVAPPAPVTPTAATPVEVVPTNPATAPEVPPVIQVAGASSPVGNGNVKGLVIAAVAVVLGL